MFGDFAEHRFHHILLLSVNTQILTEKDRRTDGNRPVFEDSSFLDRHSRLKPQTAYGITHVHTKHQHRIIVAKYH